MSLFDRLDTFLEYPKVLRNMFIIILLLCSFDFLASSLFAYFLYGTVSLEILVILFCNILFLEGTAAFSAGSMMLFLTYGRVSKSCEEPNVRRMNFWTVLTIIGVILLGLSVITGELLV